MFVRKTPSQNDASVQSAAAAQARNPFFKKFAAGAGIASLSLLAGCEGQSILPVAGIAIAGAFALTPAVAIGSYLIFSYKWKNEDASRKEGYAAFLAEKEKKRQSMPPPLYFDPEVYARTAEPYSGKSKLSKELVDEISSNSMPPLPHSIRGTAAQTLHNTLLRLSDSKFSLTRNSDSELMEQSNHLMMEIELFLASEAGKQQSESMWRSRKATLERMKPLLGKLSAFGKKAEETGNSGVREIINDFFSEIERLRPEKEIWEFTGEMEYATREDPPRSQTILTGTATRTSPSD